VGGADAKIWTTGDANFGSSSAIWFIGSTGTSNALVAKASTVSISKPILIGTGSTTDGSTYYATFDTGANSMTLTGALANNVGDATNPSTGGVKKIGTGTLIMSGTSTYTLPTTVFAGSLLVNGALLGSGTVEVQANAVLGGYGSVGLVGGAGLVGPGNSPGILSATSVDPTGGLGFAFEFTQDNPNYLAVSASGNDVFRLTDSTTPFVTSLTSANQVDVYLSQAAVALGTLTGGFFTETQVDFLTSVSSANFRYFVQSNSGSYTYNGQTYQTLAQYDASKSVTVSTVVAGSGQVTQFVVTVPEPSTLFAAGAGAVSLVLWRRRATLAKSGDADSGLAC
jgi:autotransporter-associated beta strand protein